MSENDCIPPQRVVQVVVEKDFKNSLLSSSLLIWNSTLLSTCKSCSLPRNHVHVCATRCGSPKEISLGRLSENAFRNPYVQQSWCVHVLRQVSAWLPKKHVHTNFAEWDFNSQPHTLLILGVYMFSCQSCPDDQENMYTQVSTRCGVANWNLTEHMGYAMHSHERVWAHRWQDAQLNSNEMIQTDKDKWECEATPCVASCPCWASATRLSQRVAPTHKWHNQLFRRLFKVAFKIWPTASQRRWKRLATWSHASFAKIQAPRLETWAPMSERGPGSVMQQTHN